VAKGISEKNQPIFSSIIRKMVASRIYSIFAMVPPQASLLVTDPPIVKTLMVPPILGKMRKYIFQAVTPVRLISAASHSPQRSADDMETLYPCRRLFGPHSSP
jgi:hypothetical protein